MVLTIGNFIYKEKSVYGTKRILDLREDYSNLLAYKTETSVQVMKHCNRILKAHLRSDIFEY